MQWNWEAISAIGQVVGAVAVVISLIYVAREVRKNTGATHLAAMRSMHDAYNHWIQLIARYPDLHDVYHRGVHDFESLEGTDRGRFFALMHGEFRNFEEIYPGVQAWWRLRSHWFSEKFVKFVDQVQQTAKPPQGFREAVPDQRLTNRSS